MVYKNNATCPETGIKYLIAVYDDNETLSVNPVAMYPNMGVIKINKNLVVKAYTQASGAPTPTLAKFKKWCTEDLHLDASNL